MALKGAWLPSAGSTNMFDPVSRQLGVPAAGTFTPTLSPYGPSIHFAKSGGLSRLVYGGVAEFDGVDADHTFVALHKFEDGTTPDSTNDNIIGFGTADTANFYMRTNASRVARMTVGGRDASITIGAGQGWKLWVGRYRAADEHKQIDVYNPDGTLFGSATNTTARTPNTLPVAGTPLTVGEITGTGLGGHDFELALAYHWDHRLTDEEVALLVADPFGPLRMDLSGPEVWVSAAAGTAFTIDPDGDGTITGIFNQDAAVTNLYQSVDDDPDAPVLTDYVSSGEADGDTFFTLGSVPADFDTIETPLTIRAYLASTDFGADTATLYAQVFAANETTAYTDEVQVGTQASSGLVTANFTVNATGLAADKAAWDAARIKLRWDYTA